MAPNAIKRQLAALFLFRGKSIFRSAYCFDEYDFTKQPCTLIHLSRPDLSDNNTNSYNKFNVRRFNSNDKQNKRVLYGKMRDVVNAIYRHYIP